MAIGIGQLSPEIRGLRESASNGGAWYEITQLDDDVVGVTVMVDQFGALTAFDVQFRRAGESAACFSMDISDREGTSPGSSAPGEGWVGWMGDALAIAWRNDDLEAVGATSWDTRNPFAALDEDLPDGWPDAWARLAAAIICCEIGQTEQAAHYLSQGNG